MDSPCERGLILKVGSERMCVLLLAAKEKNITSSMNIKYLFFFFLYSAGLVPIRVGLVPGVGFLKQFYKPF